MPAPRSTGRNPPTAVLRMCRIHARSGAGTGSRLGERAMRHVLKPTALVVLCGLAAGCATAEYAAEERTCYLEWAGKIPPQIEQVLVNRSEEHTYELKSLMRISYAVFCLKKKTKKRQQKID